MRLEGMLVAALAVGGCAGSGDQAMVEGGTVAERDLVGSLEVKVSPSSAVRLVLHVTNTGDAPLELTFTSSQRYDFIVETTAGEEVWRWSDDMAFMQALSQDTLPPGGSWDMDAVWDPGDRSGEYVATGVLTAREHALRQRTAFQLP